MDALIQSLILLLCLTVPAALIGIVILTWVLGMGWISIPGIGRRAEPSKSDWITVPVFSRKLTKTVAVFSGGSGSILGFIGFLMPWVQLNLGGAMNIAGSNIGANLGGQMSGVAIATFSFVAGINMLTGGNKEAGTILAGLILILFSLFVFSIPILLGVLAAMGIGLIAIPLRLLSGQLAKIARMMLAISLVASCVICGFFSLLQATIGGVGLSGSVGNTGSMAAGIQPASGFLMTVGGLLLAILAAVMMMSIAPMVEEWSRKLTDLH